MSVPSLRTQRLGLREPTTDDVAEVLVFRGDPVVQRYNDEPLTGVAQAREFIEYLRADSAADRRRHRVISLEGIVVGLVGLHSWSHHHRCAEFGYDLARSHWGRGIATEAGGAVIDYGFTTMRLHRIEAYTIADNARSARLLRQLGFGLEGVRRDPEAFPDIGRLDVSRTDTVPHLAFGHGPHHCVGAALARLELQTALHTLLTRMPTLRLAVPVDQLRWRPGMLMRTLEELSVTW